MLINGLFDKKGTIKAEHDLTIDERGIYIAYWAGIEHLSPRVIELFYKTEGSKFQHMRKTGGAGGLIWENEFTLLAFGHQYQGQNENAIYKFTVGEQAEKT